MKKFIKPYIFPGEFYFLCDKQILASFLSISSALLFTTSIITLSYYREINLSIILFFVFIASALLNIIFVKKKIRKLNSDTYQNQMSLLFKEALQNYLINNLNESEKKNNDILKMDPFYLPSLFLKIQIFTKKKDRKGIQKIIKKIESISLQNEEKTYLSILQESNK